MSYTRLKYSFSMSIDNHINNQNLEFCTNKDNNYQYSNNGFVGFFPDANAV